MRYDVGIDARMYFHTGIGTYLRELIEALQASQSGLNLKIFCPSSVHVQNAIRFDAPIYSLTEQFQYLQNLSKVKIWHSPHYNVPYFKQRTKLVVTIHDIIHWLFRNEYFVGIKAFYAETMLKRAVHLSDHIISVSEVTKADLIRHFDADADKITVISEAVSSQFKPITDSQDIARVRKQYDLPGNYFLYVGMLKGHKNVFWLAEEFMKMKRNRKSRSKLVLIGKQKDLNENWVRVRACSDILFLENIPFQDLLVLYSEALALVHPSLYEGFGLTLLEAMACGTPIIASKLGSIPEVAGNAAYLFDPSNSEELQTGLTLFEESETIRQQYKEKGFLRIQNFNWQTTAKKTVEIYERLLNS